MAKSAKENILKRIREALSNPVPLPFPNSEGNSDVFVNVNEDHLVLFAKEFTKLQGKFSFCANEADLQKQLAIVANFLMLNANELECFQEFWKLQK